MFSILKKLITFLIDLFTLLVLYGSLFLVKMSIFIEFVSEQNRKKKF